MSDTAIGESLDVVFLITKSSGARLDFSLALAVVMVAFKIGKRRMVISQHGGEEGGVERDYGVILSQEAVDVEGGMGGRSKVSLSLFHMSHRFGGEGAFFLGEDS